MPTKITLTVDDGLTAEEINDLRFMFTDAFGEFAARRTPARDYVESRYAGKDYLPDREEKVAQVRRRTALATKLYNAGFNVEVVPVKHVNHAVCLASWIPCSPTCFAQARETVSEVIEESAVSAKASIAFLQSAFGMDAEEAKLAYNQLTDQYVTKLMAETSRATKRRTFERALSHELSHELYGNKPDLDSLMKMLIEVFK